MNPRGDEHTYIRGDGAGLRGAFDELGAGVLRTCLEKSGESFDDFARILVHQVTLPFLDDFVRATGIPRDRVEITLPAYGNCAAASLPLAYAQAVERGVLRPGDRVLWVGLAGGISVGVMVSDVV